VAGYQTYGFDSKGAFPEVIDGILHDPPDYPGNEFYVGGKIVKDMKPEQAEKLAARGVTLDRDPRRLLATVADRFLGGK
jgi:CRISPR-associated protein Cst2